MDVKKYLARIGYTGPTAANAATLRDLHRAHMLAVPFENLDIALKRPISCSEEHSIHKIVDEGRGGFCYELNSAFAALLRGLGFQVTLLSARVARTTGGCGPEFDHLTLRVDLDDPWLADVGFGDSFLEPLLLTPDIEQEQDGRKFRIVEQEHTLHMERWETDKWVRQYSFTLQPRELSDFEAMCHYHQTSPESHFTQNSICSKATADGRITVTRDKVITTRNGDRDERQLSSKDEWRKALEENFGIAL